MPRRIALAFLGTLFCCPFIQSAADVDLDQIKALARNYFRDSTEIPMSVAVTTVVTDSAGKVKHQGQATVGMVFNGYNQGSGKFSFRANAGMLNAGAMHDSVSGDLAAFFAGGTIPKKDPSLIGIRQAPEPGQPVLVIVKDKECPVLEMMQRAMFPQHPCGLAQFSVNAGSHGGLMFQHFGFDTAGAPGAGKVNYLGEVQVLSFHAEVDFQEAMLPGESSPYLWPLEATASVTTNKGKVTIVNRYSPKK
jgi:hypothetical protein